MLKTKLIGDRRFYHKVAVIAIPIMIQNGITNFVGMLDNIMVGQLGTDQMSAVAIVNQLLLILNLCIFGGLSGVNIFTAQYYGKGDDEGVRHTFRISIIAACLIVLTGSGILLLFSSPLISMFLHADGGVGNVDATFRYAKMYLSMMYFGFLPFGISQAYAGIMRSTGETLAPMKAGVLAVIVNLVGNYIFIYGKFGAPEMGVVGAAFATALSRVVEMVYVIIVLHRNRERYSYAIGTYRNFFSIPWDLTKNVIKKGVPLMLNETCWAGGNTMLTQCYSLMGLSAVAALNISQTLSNVFNVAFIAMGNAICIILGQMLGADRIEDAKNEVPKLYFVTLALCAVSGGIMFLLSAYYPAMYNTSPQIRSMAESLLRVMAVCLVLYGFENASYFTLRSGGKTVMTFCFDSGFMWCAAIPLAVFLVHKMSFLGLTMIFLINQLLGIIKCVIGAYLVKRGSWAQNIT